MDLLSTVWIADIQTDVKWCFIVFWVVGKPIISWNLLRERLLEVCPLCTPAASEIYYYREEFQGPKPMEIFLLKFGCSYGWTGLLHGKLCPAIKFKLIWLSVSVIFYKVIIVIY